MNIIRKAKITDAIEIRDLVNGFATNNLMLPLSLNKIYDNLRDFSVLIKDGKIVAVAALHIVWSDIAEIRSVAIHKDYQKQGFGVKLINELLYEAIVLGLPKVFLLTYQEKFFEKFGFKVVDKHILPHKVWSDCVNCPKFPGCDEIAMLREF